MLCLAIIFWAPTSSESVLYGDNPISMINIHVYHWCLLV